MAGVKTDLEAFLYNTLGDRASAAVKEQDGIKLATDSIQKLKEKDSSGNWVDIGMNNSTGYESIFNDYNLVLINHGNYPVYDEDWSIQRNKVKQVSKISDLLAQNGESIGASIYKPGDFVYCARHGLPLNRMITLRRFAFPVTNNITDKSMQPEPDIARMITYMDDNINPVTEVCSFAWKMNWKDLSSSFEDASGGLIGDEKGINGIMGKIINYVDPAMAKQTVANPNELNYDPQKDQNRVWGPVDSIAKTKIRDVGLETDIKFDITFDYELRSINGINQKHAFIDLLSNILACTYNNGKFWGGTRYWVGKRPSTLAMSMRDKYPKDVDEFFVKGRDMLHTIMGQFGTKDQAIDTLKKIAKNALNVALGKLLDEIGRPSIFVMNSLLKNEPTGEWHLTIGNPRNPIISIGNLVITNTEFKFDTNSMSYDDIPTKFSVKVSLEPGMPLDRSGIENIFNFGQGRTYWKPESIKIRKNDNTRTRSGYFGDYSDSAIKKNVNVAFDFVRDEPKTISDNAGGTSSSQQRKPDIGDSGSTGPIQFRSIDGIDMQPY